MGVAATLYDFAAVRLNLDVELRYRAVRRVIKPLVAAERSILEIGAGKVSIGRYLGRETIAVDSSFDLRSNLEAKRVVASACSLPFSDRTWDVVCSVDMLEHIPPAYRVEAIGEMVRVSKALIALALPVGSDAFREDIWTHRYYLRQHGEPHRFAKEHVEFGLPQKDQIIAAIKDAAERTGRKVSIRAVPNLNVLFRRLYMRLAFHGSVLFRIAYVALFPLAWLGRLLDHGSCYRQIFVVQFDE